ncbi:procathepsin L-like [Pygocentrus nattereri]|uniref:procathepsin L-like n=1 Tax=Pygocentrus nattereri TaxID=42514 RepID=UPI001890BD68|nr:procathepsin L-like [Pygocentrus nattereri]
MRVLLALAALVVVAGAASVSLEDLEFHAWKQKFDKGYGSEEEETRRKMIWLDNRKLVQEHNMLADQGIKSYRLGLNHFADMDDQEFQARIGSCLGSFNMTKAHSAPAYIRRAGGADPPNYLDWRSMGYVTEVKNQQNLNSCWAFSATGALEGQMFRKTGRLISLSNQQLVDCCQDFRKRDYQGSYPEEAFKYIISAGGLQAESSYPYIAQVGRCWFNPWFVEATCRDYKTLPSGDEKTLQYAVAEIGPISVIISISRSFSQFYKSGVYDECGTNDLLHAVLVVGYGTDGFGKDYWLVKNSWGDWWGERGYFRIARNKNNQCGIASYAVFPVV